MWRQRPSTDLTSALQAVDDGGSPLRPCKGYNCGAETYSRVLGSAVVTIVGIIHILLCYCSCIRVPPAPPVNIPVPSPEIPESPSVVAGRHQGNCQSRPWTPLPSRLKCGNTLRRRGTTMALSATRVGAGVPVATEAEGDNVGHDADEGPALSLAWRIAPPCTGFAAVSRTGRSSGRTRPGPSPSLLSPTPWATRRSRHTPGPTCSTGAVR